MAPRTGEKIGWIGGWIGGFLWVAILAIVFLAQGRTVSGAGGLVIAAAACGIACATAPWKRPRTPYWKLMLPLYAALAAAVVWAVLAFGIDAVREEGGSWWSFAALVPLLIPFGVMGRRSWSDGER